MKLMGQSPPPRPGVVSSASELPLYELDFDLTQKEGMTIVGDADYVVQEIQSQSRQLGVGVIMGLFQFGSMPTPQAKQNIERFATSVLPRLRASA